MSKYKTQHDNASYNTAQCAEHTHICDSMSQSFTYKSLFIETENEKNKKTSYHRELKVEINYVKKQKTLQLN